MMTAYSSNLREVCYANLDDKLETQLTGPEGHMFSGDVKILEGLFRDEEDFEKKTSSLCFRTDPTHIIYFKPDVNQSLINDEGRREQPSAHTIINMKMEPLSLAYPKAKVYEIDTFKAENKGYLISGWNPRAPEPDFTMLDEYLEKNFPNATFLQYKKLLKKVVTQESSFRDYYEEHSTDFFRQMITIKDIEEVFGA